MNSFKVSYEFLQSFLWISLACQKLFFLRFDTESLTESFLLPKEMRQCPKHLDWSDLKLTHFNLLLAKAHPLNMTNFYWVLLRAKLLENWKEFPNIPIIRNMKYFPCSYCKLEQKRNKFWNLSNKNVFFKGWSILLYLLFVMVWIWTVVKDACTVGLCTGSLRGGVTRVVAGLTTTYLSLFHTHAHCITANQVSIFSLNCLVCVLYSWSYVYIWNALNACFSILILMEV